MLYGEYLETNHKVFKQSDAEEKDKRRKTYLSEKKTIDFMGRCPGAQTASP